MRALADLERFSAVCLIGAAFIQAGITTPPLGLRLAA
jgi:hypothetical protein